MSEAEGRTFEDWIGMVIGSHFAHGDWKDMPLKQKRIEEDFLNRITPIIAYLIKKGVPKGFKEDN